MSDNIIKTYRISKNHFTPTNPEVEKQIIENEKHIDGLEELIEKLENENRKLKGPALNCPNWVSGPYKGRKDVFFAIWIGDLHGFGVREIDGYEFLHRRENGGVTVDGNPVNQGTDLYLKKP